MGAGFFSALGQAALGAAEDQFGINPPDMQSANSNKGNLLTNTIGRYLRSKQQNAQTAPGANVPARSNYDPNVPGIVSPHVADPSNPQDPNFYEEPGAQGPDQSGSQIPNQNQWQAPPTTPALLGAVPALARGATLVSQPTIAKIGEKGPEMIVPLDARADNRVQPDVLEGNVMAQKVPGMRYNRYKSYINRAY